MFFHISFTHAWYTHSKYGQIHVFKEGKGDTENFL